MRATPPGNEIIRLSIPALSSQEGRYGFSKSFLHINDGPVLVNRQHFDFAPQNVMHFPHGSLRLRTDAQRTRSMQHNIAYLEDVRFGSQADMCSAQRHVRFTPNSNRESKHPQTVMSALFPKADVCGANLNVRFGPKADTDIF